MLSISKCFHFEAAHAIHGYDGDCRHIHGHSYQLQVTLTCLDKQGDDFVDGQGFVIDFKELKRPVADLINKFFDHKLIVSRHYLQDHPELNGQDNLVTWEFEPTAENILIYFSRELKDRFPGTVRLSGLKIFETKDSFAEWSSN